VQGLLFILAKAQLSIVAIPSHKWDGNELPNVRA